MFGIAMAAMMPMMAMTTSISTREKPALREVLIFVSFMVRVCLVFWLLDFFGRSDAGIVHSRIIEIVIDM